MECLQRTNKFYEVQTQFVLNKIEFVFSLQLINGMAQMRKAKFGVVDMDFVLGIGGYDLDRLVYLFSFV